MRTDAFLRRAVFLRRGFGSSSDSSKITSDASSAGNSTALASASSLGFLTVRRRRVVVSESELLVAIYLSHGQRSLRQQAGVSKRNRTMRSRRTVAQQGDVPEEAPERVVKSQQTLQRSWTRPLNAAEGVPGTAQGRQRCAERPIERRTFRTQSRPRFRRMASNLNSRNDCVEVAGQFQPQSKEKCFRPEGTRADKVKGSSRSLVAS